MVFFSFFFSSRRGGDECGQQAISRALFRLWVRLIFRTPILRREARGAVPQGTFPTPNIRTMADKTLYTQVRTMENHDDSVWDLAVTKEYVYSAGYDGKISEWDVNNGNLTHTFNIKDGEIGHDKQIWSCAVDETLRHK